jgi:putative heme transporter
VRVVRGTNLAMNGGRGMSSWAPLPEQEPAREELTSASSAPGVDVAGQSRHGWPGQVRVPRRRRPRLWWAVASLPLVGAGLLWALPWATGAAWTGIGVVLGGLSLRMLTGLALLWVAGLVAYSFVLTGALPGLTRRRALTLNLTGSAVSNLAPMGGAVGVTTNLIMLRTWQFRPAALAAYAAVTNIWDVLGKLTLPMVAVLAVVGGGGGANGALPGAAAVTAVLWCACVAGIVLVLRSDRVAAALAKALVRVLPRVLPQRLARRSARIDEDILNSRAHARTVIATTWPQLTAGTLCYMALQGGLLWACVGAVGARIPAHAAVAAYAVERLLTLAVVAPGGAGLAEAGSAGVLVALGTDPLAAASGVLLYRGFAFLLEIPVGGLWLCGWLLTRAMSRQRPA